MSISSDWSQPRNFYSRCGAIFELRHKFSPFSLHPIASQYRRDSSQPWLAVTQAEFRLIAKQLGKPLEEEMDMHEYFSPTQLECRDYKIQDRLVFSKIYNPTTRRWVDLNNKLGQRLYNFGPTNDQPYVSTCDEQPISIPPSNYFDSSNELSSSQADLSNE